MDKIRGAAPSERVKNGYEAPRLRKYGDVSSLTQNVGANDGNDGGVVAGMTKKSV